jgi:hypothetical protein
MEPKGSIPNSQELVPILSQTNPVHITPSPRNCGLLCTTYCSLMLVVTARGMFFARARYVHVIPTDCQHVGSAVTICACIQDVLGSNPGQNTCGTVPCALLRAGTLGICRNLNGIRDSHSVKYQHPYGVPCRC